MSLLFFVVDSVCLSVCLTVCHAAPSNRFFFFFVFRWNRAIFWPSSLYVALYKTLFFYFYRAKLRVAQYCHGMLSVCLSVRLSVTLRYRDHIRSNSAKIISPQNRSGVGKIVNFRHLSRCISRKRCKIGSKLLLTTNMNMYTRFRLVPKSVTLDDL